MGVAWSGQEGAKMKSVKKVYEFIIIILLAIIIVTPEIIYSCLLEVRDWIKAGKLNG